MLPILTSGLVGLSSGNGAFLQASGTSDARAALVDGVDRLIAPGSPGNVVVWGRSAQPVVVDGRGRIIVGAVEAPGRIVALSHNGYLAPPEHAPTRRFLLNAVRWAGQGKIERVEALGATATWLREQGLPVAEVRPSWLGRTGTVVVVDAHRLTSEDGAALRSFVRQGGGVVLAATGWGWQQGSRQPMQKFIANEALRPFGIGFGDQFADPDGQRTFDVTRLPAPEHHAGRALQALRSGATSSVAAGRAGVDLLRVIPSQDPWLKEQVETLRGGRSPVVGPKNPLPASDGAGRFLIALQWQKIEQDPLQIAEPSASLFPGAVATTAQRVTRDVMLRPNESRWQGTGLYAPPSERITITLPPELAQANVQIRIGAHTDANWHHDRWERFPQVSLAFPIAANRVSVQSPFGGLIYIELPRPLASATKVTVQGAVESPRFVLGQTTPEQWRQQLAKTGAPWAEIESEHLVVTVPTSGVTGLADPTSVAKFWDEIAHSAADLAQTPRWRGFKERFVADAQISAGYMHAGYPIKTHLDVVDLVTNVNTLREKGSWGHFHELGHNHQSDLWTFDGTVEVTVNLFTLYAYDRVLGKRPADRTFDAAHSLRVYRTFERNGKGFARWSNEPFTALAMYAQLQNAFGWDTYKKLFKEYQQIPAASRPRTEAEKRDQWMIRFSRAVGRNLGPFFDRWSVPVSQQAKAQVANLPEWLPEGM